jgi:predicted GIY-YIG superfamily endonuclease
MADDLETEVEDIEDKCKSEDKCNSEDKCKSEDNCKSEDMWVFYIVHNKGCTYAGVSPDPVKRLRKHNGEISGGAKYTLSKGPGWEHVCLISGFKTKIQALQFEWASKHVPPRDAGGLINRVKKLYILLNKAQWTSKSPLAKTIPLTIEWKMSVECKDRTVPSYIKVQPI